MKKLILIPAVILLTLTSVNVQGGNGIFMFGVKAGYTLSSIKVKNHGTYFNDARQGGRGWHAGLQVRLTFPVIGIYVQPELLYGWSKYDASTVSIPAGILPVGGDYRIKRRISQWDIPLMVGWGIGFAGIKVRVNAGPVFNLSAKSKLSGETGGQKLISNLDMPAVSYAVGAGLDLWKITLDVRYNGQFKKSSEYSGISSVVEQIQSRHHCWTFSLGVMF